MKLSEAQKNTICALATPTGQSALAIIRVSGEQSLEILKKLCPKLQKEIKSHLSYLSYIYDVKDQVIDQVVVTFFQSQKSYTGEQSFEISCHGNPILIKKILARLIELGARSAHAGEFTYRAFMNKKIDLVQAEAIHSLIVSQTDQAAKMSLRQLDGQISALLKKIESDLIWCLAHIEASIDFSTEGLDIIDDTILLDTLSEIESFLSTQINQFSKGQIIKSGLKVALIGEPNVGKSSLLNLLVQSEKAIVADVAGTTRDIIEAQTIYDGQIFNFSDTAGLRETADVVEKIGVSKSLLEVQKADLNIFIIDCASPSTSLFSDYILATYKSEKDFVQSAKFIILFNKVDLISEKIKSDIEELFSVYLMKQYGFSKEDLARKFLFVSSLELQDRQRILQTALDQFESLTFLDEALISSARQIEMVKEAYQLIGHVKAEMASGLGTEFIAQSLKEALLSVQRILGHIYDDQILDRVFKEFCLGK
jgi:tRNA modification GTPase